MREIKTIPEKHFNKNKFRTGFSSAIIMIIPQLGKNYFKSVGLFFSGKNFLSPLIFKYTFLPIL